MSKQAIPLLAIGALFLGCLIANLSHETSSSRLLTDSPVSGSFLGVCLVVFQSLLSVSRNLIVVGVVLGLLDALMPFILLSESFLMLGLWTCQKHYLTTMYNNVFNSKWDIINLPRLMFSPGSDSNTFPQMSQYNFSSFLLYNLSGELTLTIIFLVATVFCKAGSVFLKSERLRAAAAKLRPLWNAYFFAILPRVATFGGLHCRLTDGGFGIANIIGSSIVGVLLIFFFIQLLVQIRRINSKIEYLEQSRLEIGVVGRLDYKRQFQFDCLQYSMLYYPVMNYIRLLLFFVPIGASWDFYYASYGGAILSQLIMMMIEVSCSGYTLRRDKVLFPLQNFLLMIAQLCVITVGLAESVSHSQVSEVAQTVLFSLLLFILPTSLLGVILDCVQELRQRCSAKQKQEQGEEEELATQKFVRSLAKPNGAVSEVKKSQGSDQLSQSDQPEQVDHSSVSLSKKTYKIPNLKIKKVRKGKII